MQLDAFARYRPVGDHDALLLYLSAKPLEFPAQGDLHLNKRLNGVLVLRWGNLVIRQSTSMASHT